MSSRIGTALLAEVFDGVLGSSEERATLAGLVEIVAFPGEPARARVGRGDLFVERALGEGLLAAAWRVVRGPDARGVYLLVRRSPLGEAQARERALFDGHGCLRGDGLVLRSRRPRLAPVRRFSEDVPAGLVTEHLWQEWHASQAPVAAYAGPTTDDRRVVENGAAGALVAKATLHLCFLERAVATFAVDVAGADYWAKWELVDASGTVVKTHARFSASNFAAANATAKLATGRQAWMWDGRNAAASPVFVASGVYQSRLTVKDGAGATRTFTSDLTLEGSPYELRIVGQPKTDAELLAELATRPAGGAGRLLTTAGERIGGDCWLMVFRGQQDDGHQTFLGHGTIEATIAEGASRHGAIQTPHGVDFKGWIRLDPRGDAGRPDRVQIEDVGVTNARIALTNPPASPVSNPFTDDPSHGPFKDGVQAHAGAALTTDGLSVGCTTSCPLTGRSCADPGAVRGAVRSIDSSFGTWGDDAGEDVTVRGPTFENKQNKRDVADALLADDHAAPLLDPAGPPACGGAPDEPLHMQDTVQRAVFGGFLGHEIPRGATVADAPSNKLRVRMRLESYAAGSAYHVYHHAVGFGHEVSVSGRELTARLWIPRKVIRDWNGNRRNVLVRGNLRVRWTLEHLPEGATERTVLHTFLGTAGGDFVDLPNGEIGRSQHTVRLADPPPARPYFSVFRYQLRLLPFDPAVDAWVAEPAYTDVFGAGTGVVGAETLTLNGAGDRRFAEGQNELTLA